MDPSTEAKCTRAHGGVTPSGVILSQLPESAMSESPSRGISRRAALELLGMSATCAAVVPRSVLAQTPSFPKGAIIRTLFKDYAPEDLAGGATLFHEHMSLAPDFMDKFRAASAAVRAMNAGPAGAGAPGGG